MGYIVYYLFGKDLLQAIGHNEDEEKFGPVHGLTIYVRDIASMRPEEELNDQLDLCFIFNWY